MSIAIHRYRSISTDLDRYQASIAVTIVSLPRQHLPLEDGRQIHEQRPEQRRRECHQPRCPELVQRQHVLLTGPGQIAIRVFDRHFQPSFPESIGVLSCHWGMTLFKESEEEGTPTQQRNLLGLSARVLAYGPRATLVIVKVAASTSADDTAGGLGDDAGWGARRRSSNVSRSTCQTLPTPRPGRPRFGPSARRGGGGAPPSGAPWRGSGSAGRPRG